MSQDQDNGLDFGLLRSRPPMLNHGGEPAPH